MGSFYTVRLGGYAVGYHGYPRATVDMDIWIGRSPETAAYKCLAPIRHCPAVAAAANRGVYSNRILSGVDPTPMRCQLLGLTPPYRR